MIFTLRVFVRMQNIKVESGDMRSPMFGMYRELEFLRVCVLCTVIKGYDNNKNFNEYLNKSVVIFQTLAEILKTGETEWMEPVESTSAVNLIKAYLEGTCIQ